MVAAYLLSLWSENKRVFLRSFKWQEEGKVIKFSEVDEGNNDGALVKLTDWGDCDFTNDPAAFDHQSKTRLLMKRYDERIRSQRWSPRRSDLSSYILLGAISNEYSDTTELPFLLLEWIFAPLACFGSSAFWRNMEQKRRSVGTDIAPSAVRTFEPRRTVALSAVTSLRRYNPPSETAHVRSGGRCSPKTESIFKLTHYQILRQLASDVTPMPASCNTP